jgi:hypothetical protein
MFIVVVCLMAFSAILNNISVIVAVSLIREVNRTTLRKTPTCRKSLFIVLLKGHQEQNYVTREQTLIGIPQKLIQAQEIHSL